MANKTQPTKESVKQFLLAIEDEQKRKDCIAIAEMMQAVTGEKPVMWNGMIGFGSYHYKYESGREGDCFRIGFSPRKANISLYGLSGPEENQTLFSKLGKHKTGKGCLYINKLDDVNAEVLKQLMLNGYQRFQTPKERATAKQS